VYSLLPRKTYERAQSVGEGKGGERKKEKRENESFKSLVNERERSARKGGRKGGRDAPGESSSWTMTCVPKVMRPTKAVSGNNCRTCEREERRKGEGS